MHRTRCKFKHNGTPTTKPGTESDAKRIALSQWITAMLVFNGDETQGAYQTPGATAYSDEYLASAKLRFPPEPKRSNMARPRLLRRTPPPKSRPAPPVELPAPAIPLNDEWQLLKERLADLRVRIGRAKTEIDSLTNQK